MCPQNDTAWRGIPNTVSDDEYSNDGDDSGTYKPNAYIPWPLDPRSSARLRDSPAPYIRTSLSPEAPIRKARRAARKRAREAQSETSAASSARTSKASNPVHSAASFSSNFGADDVEPRSPKRPRTSGVPQTSSVSARHAAGHNELRVVIPRVPFPRYADVFSLNNTPAGKYHIFQSGNRWKALRNPFAAGVRCHHQQIGDTSSDARTTHGATKDVSTAPASSKVACAEKDKSCEDNSAGVRLAKPTSNHGDSVISRLRDISLDYVCVRTSSASVGTQKHTPGHSISQVRAVTGTLSSTAGHVGDTRQGENVQRKSSKVDPVTAPGASRLPSQLNLDRHKRDADSPEGPGEDRRDASLGSAGLTARSRETSESQSPGNAAMAGSVPGEATPAGKQPQHGEQAAPVQGVPASEHRNNGGQLFLAQPSQPSQATNSPAPASAVHQSSVPRQQPQAAAPPGAPVLSREAAGESAQQPFARAQSGGSDALLGRPRARPRGAGGADTDAPLSRAPPAEPRDDHRAVQARSQTAPPAASRASDGVRGQTGAPRPHARSHASLARHDEVRVPPERVDGSSAAGAEIDAEAAEGGAAPMQADPDAAPENASDALSRIVSTLPVRAAPIQIAAALRGYGLATERDIQAIARWSKFGLETLVEDLKTEGFTKADAITIVEGLRAAAGMVGRTM
ncbi:hypothetical protein CERSUDRAFT_99279 [Gelatoporia subvermispora B]|uniref:Uncharacterized protein n=1 Tax=Ceriporiopsis subvermispora (strain B) TaxID=914234 RepID=M2Q6U3_CERS8|nr:hypothetical protein CERSUDRAFT_99279 [Gelatoporia subvermispora B]